ncbi:MAG: DUF4350 domain-containing protein [Zestosphaera sp.]
MVIGVRELGKALLALLLMAFIAEPIPVGVVVSGASPINTGYDGTSSLVDVLKDLGYDVRLVRSWGLTWLTSRTDTCRVLIVVSPERPFTSEEATIISGLVREGAHLIIADEYIHSNVLLESLRLESRISGEYVNFNGSYIFPAKVNLSRFDAVIYFAYASSVRRSRGDVIVMSRGNVVLGVRIDVGKSVVYVLSDGSIFTNAALTDTSPNNPYVQLVSALLTDLCPSGTVYIESSKYGLRPLTISEVLSTGNLSYIAAALTNPFRYALIATQSVDPTITAIFVLIALTIVSATFLDQVLPLKGIAWIPSELYEDLRRRHVTTTLKGLICVEGATKGVQRVCKGDRVRLGLDDVDWIIARASSG